LKNYKKFPTISKRISKGVCTPEFHPHSETIAGALEKGERSRKYNLHRKTLDKKSSKRLVN